MKQIFSLALIFFTLLSGGVMAQNAPVQTTSPGCNSNCKWSNCAITVTYAMPPGGGCVCGCYYGLAMCRCEQNETKALTNSQVVHVATDGIEKFKSWLDSKHNEHYVPISRLLGSLNKTEIRGDEYAPIFDRYKALIEALPAAEKQELFNYTGDR